MEAQEIREFVNEVYEQCVNRKMTCEDFDLFAHYIEMRKGSALNEVHERVKNTPLPNNC